VKKSVYKKKFINRTTEISVENPREEKLLISIPPKKLPTPISHLALFLFLLIGVDDVNNFRQETIVVLQGLARDDVVCSLILV